jgi:Holliday junction resolvase RusA-like endonuclease
MEIEFCIPGHPPSSNSIFATIWKTKRRIKSKEYVEFEKLVFSMCMRAPNQEIFRAMKDTPYNLSIQLIDTTWRFKNGKAKRFDIDNRIKSLSDAICKCYGWKDEYCVEVKASKIIGDEIKTIARFNFLTPNDLR